MRNVLRHLGLVVLVPISNGWCLQYGDLQTLRLEYPGRTSVSGYADAYVRATGLGELGQMFFLLGCEDTTRLPSPYTGGYKGIYNTAPDPNRLAGNVTGTVYRGVVGGGGGVSYYNTAYNKYIASPVPANTKLKQGNEVAMHFSHLGSYSTCKKTSVWVGWDSKPSHTTIEYPYNGGTRYGNGATGSYYLRVAEYYGQQQYTELLYYSYIHLEPGDRAVLLRQSDKTHKLTYSYSASPELVGHVKITDRFGNEVTSSGTSHAESLYLYITNVSNYKGRINGHVSVTVQIA